MRWRRKWQPIPVFLPGESQGQRSLVGCHLWGLRKTESLSESERLKWHSSSSSSWIANGKRSDSTLVAIPAESQWPRREEVVAVFSWGTDSPVCYAFHSSYSFPNTQAIYCSPAEVICCLPAYFHNFLILNKYFSVPVSLAVVKRDHEIMGGIIFCLWKNCSICLIFNTPTVQEMQETQVGSLGQGEPLEEGRAIHSSILAWRLPWTEEPGGLQSIGLQRVRHDWSNLACMYSFVTFWFIGLWVDSLICFWHYSNGQWGLL